MSRRPRYRLNPDDASSRRAAVGRVDSVMPVQASPEDKCTTNGGILLPCLTLERALDDNAPTRRGGLVYFEVVNVATGEPARSIAIAKTGDFKKQGIVLKVCPFCGADIFSHWQSAGEHAS